MPDIRIVSVVLALLGARVLWRDIRRAYSRADASATEALIRQQLKKKLMRGHLFLCSMLALFFGWVGRLPDYGMAALWALFAAALIFWIQAAIQVDATKSLSDGSQDPE